MHFNFATLCSFFWLNLSRNPVPTEIMASELPLEPMVVRSLYPSVLHCKCGLHHQGIQATMRDLYYMVPVKVMHPRIIKMLPLEDGVPAKVPVNWLAMSGMDSVIVKDFTVDCFKMTSIAGGIKKLSQTGQDVSL